MGSVLSFLCLHSIIKRRDAQAFSACTSATGGCEWLFSVKKGHKNRDFVLQKNILKKSKKLSKRY
jgi:hypothetical protein